MTRTPVDTAAAGNDRRRKISLALRKASREVYELDDELRRACIEQMRETLNDSTFNQRDRLGAASFVLKLSQFNLEHSIAMAEIGAILGEDEEHDKSIDVVINKNFFGNDAHEAVEYADQNLSGETSEAATDRSSAAASSPTADPA